MTGGDQPVDSVPVHDRVEAEAGGDHIGIDPFAEPQTHHQGFVGGFRGGELRFLYDAVTVAPQRREEVFRLAMAERAHAEASAVRARPDASVIGVSPVGEIVPALLARPTVVADL